MIINEDVCIKCGSCVPYCPTSAIIINKEKSFIIHDECVECGNCIRAEVCPAGALVRPELEWPRIIRRELSDPTVRPSTGSGNAGRGTAEVKNNDVTGRFRRGQVGLGIEVGRPGIGTSLKNVEKIAMSLKKADPEIKFEQKNPCTHFMSDQSTGKFKEDILNEKVLTIILELLTDSNNLSIILKTLEDVSKEIDTVFSVCIITRAEEDGSLPNVEVARKLGYNPTLSAKVNLGLGRPLIND